MVWESRHDQGRSNACLIHPELVIVRHNIQYTYADHAFPLSQSIHHINRIENRTKLARCCKCPCLDIPFLAKFVGSRCILGGLLFVLPLLGTLKVWGWLSTRLWHNCQDLDHCCLSQKLKHSWWSSLAHKMFEDLKVHPCVVLNLSRVCTWDSLTFMDWEFFRDVPRDSFEWYLQTLCDD